MGYFVGKGLGVRLVVGVGCIGLCFFWVLLGIVSMGMGEVGVGIFWGVGWGCGGGWVVFWVVWRVGVGN